MAKLNFDCCYVFSSQLAVRVSFSSPIRYKVHKNPSKKWGWTSFVRLCKRANARHPSNKNLYTFWISVSGFEIRTYFSLQRDLCKIYHPVLRELPSYQSLPSYPLLWLFLFESYPFSVVFCGSRPNRHLFTLLERWAVRPFVAKQYQLTNRQPYLGCACELTIYFDQSELEFLCSFVATSNSNNWRSASWLVWWKPEREA